MTTGHTHRASESGDYSRLRHGMDPTMKKALFALLGLLVIVVGTLLGFDRADIKGDASVGMMNSIKNGAELGVLKNEIEHVKGDVEDLKVGQRMIRKEMREGQQAILDTLYTLPAERRRSAKPVLPLAEAPE